MDTVNISKPNKYMNPYLAGVLLGLVLLASFYLTGRGLGASGATKAVVVSAVNSINHEHSVSSPYFSKYIHGDDNPLKTWLVLEILGVIVGGFISGALAGRLNFKLERSPKITPKRRVIFATIGGFLFGFGSQLGRGCTGGAALTGMANLSLGALKISTTFGLSDGIMALIIIVMAVFMFWLAEKAEKRFEREDITSEL